LMDIYIKRTVSEAGKSKKVKRYNIMDAAQSTHDAGTKQAIQIPPLHKKKSQKVKHRPWIQKELASL
jgi:hypothetical protein